MQTTAITSRQPSAGIRGVDRAGDRDAGSMLDELLTTRQIADLLQLRVSTVEDYARRGLIPSMKLGRHRRYLRTQVEQALQNLAR